MKTFLLGLLFIAPTLALASVPNFPMAFWGTVTLDGVDAPSGTIIRAYYGTSTLGGVVTVKENGIYGYTEPTKQKLIVGEGVGVITFTVQLPSFNNGNETKGTMVMTANDFVSGETLEKTLTFVSVPIPPTTSNGSGGGGGSSSHTTGGSSTLLPQGQVLGAATSTTSATSDDIITLQKKVISLLTILMSLLQQLIATQNLTQ